ncbi:MAG: hypothetical protein RSD40_00860 [Bacilli bacterium]
MNKTNYPLLVELFNKVIIEKEELFEIINHVLPQKVSTHDEKLAISTVLGATIRHYYLFRSVFNVYFKDADDKLFAATALTYSDLYFSHKLGEKSSVINEFLLYAESIEQLELAKSIIEYFGDKKPFDILETEFRAKSLMQYFSIRFNIPDWIIRMWAKQYGKNISYKIIKNVSAKAPRYIKQNEALTDSNFKLDSAMYKQLSDVKEVYEYVGKDNLKKINDNVLSRIYVTNLLDNEVVENLDESYADSIVLYFYDKPNIYLNILNKFRSNNRISIMTDSFHSSNKVAENVKRIKSKGFSNIYIGECATDVLEAQVSKNANIVILYTKSSNFNYIQGSPEYFINFDQSSLSDIIEQEKKDLDNCSKFVAIGGDMVYITQTLNKKENELLIQEFLDNNNSFVLDSEKTFFPATSKMIGYFAKLTRIK